ncbi:MAG: MoaD/ThiS family protein [Alphaproteobacteria bacterium]
MINISLSPFGHMREYFTDSLDITLEAPNIMALRSHLITQFPEAKDVIELCAFSDDKHIFSEDEAFAHGAKLSILPPVCGG